MFAAGPIIPNVVAIYGFINNLHEEQKEITQNSFRILEEQLKHLQQENSKLLNLLEKTIK